MDEQTRFRAQLDSQPYYLRATTTGLEFWNSRYDYVGPVAVARCSERTAQRAIIETQGASNRPLAALNMMVAEGYTVPVIAGHPALSL